MEPTRLAARIRSLPFAERWRRDVAANLLVAGLYFGSALAGNALRLTGNVDTVWLPVGVGIVALYLGGLRLLPGVVVGDILADLPHRLPLAPSVGQTCGNLLEVVVAAMLLRRLVRTGSPLERLDGVGYLIVSVLAGTVISASVGTMSLFRGGVITSDQLPDVWRSWFLGDTCGALVVVPLALAWLLPRLRPFIGRILEAAVVLAATVALTELGLRIHGTSPVMYLVFPALTWAALRFGARGGTTAVAVTTTLVIWETAHSTGPFVVHSITDEVLSIQLYVAVAAVSTMVVAAIVAERELFAEGVSASRSRILEATDAERRRLERDLHDGAQQRLSALAIRLNAFEQDGEGSEAARDLLRRTNREIAQALDELRELAHGIHPAVLTDFGLEPALRNMAARSSVPVSVVAQLPPGRLDATVESTAYYVVAESLANAQRHGRCTSVAVLLSLTEDALQVRVIDDGAGGARELPGSGLEGLRDRVESVGGSFVVLSVQGRGTHVYAAIPQQAPS
jgi:signal transduction histidine kinase